MTEPAAASRAHPSDADLVQAYRNGDERGATELVLRHARAVARFLAGAGADPADVDDLVQETFLRAFRAVRRWRGEASFRTWLLVIARNQLRDHRRRHGGRQVLALEEGDAFAPDDPASALEATELERRLEAGLRRLPRLQREVFLLRAQQGLDYEAIAAALETTPGAARVHYHHALKRLKDLVT